MGQICWWYPYTLEGSLSELEVLMKEINNIDSRLQINEKVRGKN